MPLNQVHEICDQVIERLEEFPEVDRAYVHIEPEAGINLPLCYREVVGVPTVRKFDTYING
jgi:hypothetical protein